ncbi:MAG: site-specific DNA-methyltransferase, partial [Chloroflexota bacterium]|nr:site-specific DNA-methyltransferase [Chloroflexota bacterium]
SFDMVITSPPYANRYDYTRTYALELAWLGFGQEDFSALRQQMLSATVENKSKREWLRGVYGHSALLESAIRMYEGQEALHEVLGILRERMKELSNPHVIRLLEGYFLEMALVVAELGRVMQPGGAVVMVNDNVQYHGEEVPVDLILSDYAEQCGFTCKQIWVLPRGKGNSSQQMGRFGRRELRKCVYWWVRDNDYS